jgi:hypothetical protein
MLELQELYGTLILKKTVRVKKLLKCSVINKVIIQYTTAMLAELVKMRLVKS